MARRVISWMLTMVMLVSCMTMVAMPAVAAEETLVNLYNDATDGSCARADTVSTSQTKGLSTPYLLGSTEYVTTEPIAVGPGDKLYFGPANAGQGYQGVFYPALGGNGSNFGANNCTKVFEFDGKLCTTSSANVADKTVAMYCYTATASGTVRLTFPQEYHDVFVVTKNQPMTYDSYYAHIDAIPNRNLWNYYTGLKNLIKEDGTVNTTNANHYATHYIAVKEGDTITWGPHRNPTAMFYGAVGYNAEKVGVTGAIAVDEARMSAGVKLEGTFSAENRPNTADAAANTYGIYTYTVPAGVSYVRVLLRPEVADRFIVQKNNPFDVKEYWELMGGDLNSPLFGGDVLWLGDSIGQAAQDMKVNNVDLDGWVGRVSKSLNMNWVNNSRSGWSLGTGRLDGGNSRIVGRLFDGIAAEPESGYDLVMLHGGTNDAWSNTAVGEMSDSFYPGDFDVNTFSGALEELFYHATTLYGDTAEIAYILNFKMADRTNAGKVHDMDANYEEALKICEKWGIIPIDLYHNATINNCLDNVTLFLFSDFVHPGRRGYDYLSPFITDGLINAANGNAWGKDEGDVADAITADLKSGVAADAHFTAESKTAFGTATATQGTAWEKLAAATAAAPALVQDKEHLISINDMTKYWFADPTELAVSSVADLRALAHYVNVVGYVDEDVTIRQTNDIAMSGTLNIGTSAAAPFKANYDGQGYAITGWNSSSTNSVGTALFPRINGATIKNVVMKNAYINGGQHTALMVGYIHGDGNLIENCHVMNSTIVKTSGNGMAAIALQPANANATTTDLYTIRNCTVSNTTFNVATSSGSTSNVGFIVSRATRKEHLIENCYSYNNRLVASGGATVNAVGGILGEAYSATVRNCGVYGNEYVVAENATGSFGSAVAGVVGQVYNASDILYLDNCYSDMAEYPLYYANGTVVGKNHYSVKAGNVTAEEITGNVLAAKLNAATDLRWAASPIDENTTIPMVTDRYFANQIVKLGDATFYTNAENGKIDATPAELAAVAGKIWRRGNETTLTADLMKRVYTESETWAESAFLFGDCMGSGNLDTGDAVAILRTLAGKSVEGYNAEYADVNLDGTVNLLDAVQILRYVLIGKNV